MAGIGSGLGVSTVTEGGGGDAGAVTEDGGGVARAAGFSGAAVGVGAGLSSTAGASAGGVAGSSVVLDLRPKENMAVEEGIRIEGAGFIPKYEPIFQ